MKGKPIEPGCLAIIVKVRYSPQNLGRVVRALFKAPPDYVIPGCPVQRPFAPPPDDNGPLWVIEVPPGSAPLEGTLVDKTYKVMGTYQTKTVICPERWLVRIDDGDTTEPRVTETHKPKTEQVF